MNAIMSRKLRGKQDSDKSLHNFTQRQQAAEEAFSAPRSDRSGYKAGAENMPVIAALNCVREVWVVPPGLSSFFSLSQR
jgi:hypothetical protein